MCSLPLQCQMPFISVYPGAARRPKPAERNPLRAKTSSPERANRLRQFAHRRVGAENKTEGEHVRPGFEPAATPHVVTGSKPSPSAFYLRRREPFLRSVA